MKVLQISFLTLVAIIGLLPAVEFSCFFKPDGWSQQDWLPVKTPRWDELGGWQQNGDHLQNRIPEGMTDEQLVSCHEAYVSMLWKEPIEGNAVISSTMSFDDRYAPAIVLSGELASRETASGAMAEYREHWEIVLYADGLNVWHHEFIDGKPCWRLAAWLKHPFAARGRHRLSAKVEFGAKGPMLTVTCDDQTFGCLIPSFPKTYRAGIMACEGLNRFYDFQVK